MMKEKLIPANEGILSSRLTYVSMYIPFTFSLKHRLLKLSVLVRNGRRVGYSFSLRDETHLKIVLFLILCIGWVGDLHMQCSASRVQEMALDSWNWGYRNYGCWEMNSGSAGTVWAGPSLCVVPLFVVCFYRYDQVAG